MLSTTDTINKFTQSAGQSGPSFTISNFTNQVNTEIINNGEYAVSGYEVYAIRNTTPASVVHNESRVGKDATGSFTITCTTAGDISFIIIAGGGSGCGHPQGNGGGSSGQSRYIKVTLQPGSYVCNYIVGVGGCTFRWGSGNATTTNGNGRNSSLTLNGQTYTSFGGVIAGRTIYSSSEASEIFYSNGTSWGGAGRSNIYNWNGTASAYKGTQQTYSGGQSRNTLGNGGSCSAGGGAGMGGNGQNGSTNQNGILRSSGPGGIGGLGINYNSYPEFNFDSGLKWFCDGGCGSAGYNYVQNFVVESGVDVPNVSSPNNIGGKGAGIKTITNGHPGLGYECSDAQNHTGSGGGSSFSYTGKYINGSPSQYSGCGANGIIIISFQA